MILKYTLAIILFIIMLTACTKKNKPEQIEITQQPTIAPILANSNCQTTPTVVTLQYGKVNLPTTGKFIVESHYATQGEVFKFNQGLFPAHSTEGIQRHLEASCKLLKEHSLQCPKYDMSWEKVWTPSEGGLVGQGAIGNERPTLWQELWQGNLLFKKLPKAGTKFIVINKATGKSIVASFGFEVGPLKKYGFGGLTVEAMDYLKATNGNDLYIGELKDQSLDYGPIQCTQEVSKFLPEPTLPVQPPVKVKI